MHWQRAVLDDMRGSCVCLNAVYASSGRKVGLPRLTLKKAFNDRAQCASSKGTMSCFIRLSLPRALAWADEQAGEALRGSADAGSAHITDVLQVPSPMWPVGGAGGDDGPQDSGSARLPKRRVSSPAKSRSRGRFKHWASVRTTLRGHESNTRDDGRGDGVQPVERRATCMLRM